MRVLYKFEKINFNVNIGSHIEQELIIYWAIIRNVKVNNKNVKFKKIGDKGPKLSHPIKQLRIDIMFKLARSWCSYQYYLSQRKSTLMSIIYSSFG